jgi:hypothetical protein
MRVALALALLLLPQALQASSLRFGVILGNNRGRDPERELRFAERDARRIYDVLIELGGFSPQSLHLVLGGDAEQARQAIGRVQAELQRVASSSAHKTLFLFYYSGHAEDDVLELGRSALPYAEIRELMHGAAATTRIALIDACHSGNMVSSKGGRRQSGYEIALVDELVSRGYAIVTSGAEDELSQESAEIRGAFFTNYLVSGLRGAADQSGDGRVTLAEAYRYAYGRTVARTSLSLGGTQHPMYEFRLAGRGEVVLTQEQVGGSRITVTPPGDGRVVVLDDQREHMVADADARFGEPLRINVPPGRYRVYHVTADALAMAPVQVHAGSDATLRPAAFASREVARPVAKGGLFRPRWSQHMQAAAIVRRWPLAGSVVEVGGALQWRAWGPWPVEPTLRLSWSTAPDRGASTGYHSIGLAAGAATTWEIAWLALRAELFTGYEHLFQDKDRYSGSAIYLVGGTAETGIGPLRFALGGGVGGHLFKLRGKGITHRFDLQAMLGIGWVWRAEP